MPKMYILGMTLSETSISISDLRQRLHDALKEVRLGKEYIVLFHQRPIARIVSGSSCSLVDTQEVYENITVTYFRDHIHQVIGDVEYKKKQFLIQKRGVEMAKLIPISENSSKIQGLTTPIISLVSLKGGVGKTTSTIHLASVAAQEGYKVVVLDGDSEHSAVHWGQLAESLGKLDFQILPCEERTVITQARELRDNGHTVFIDTPPNDRALLMKAAGIADHIIVPVAPTGIDLDRLRGTLQLLSDTSALSNRDMDVAILLVRFVARKALAKEAEELLKDFPILSTKIRALKSYEESFGSSPAYLEEYKEVWKEVVS